MSSKSTEDLFRYLEQTRELFGNELYSQQAEDKNPADTEITPNLSYQEKTLEKFKEKIQSCEQCSLGSTRQNFVFGVGDQKANLLLVGEAPGAEEDKQGEPFVGRAGKLLDKILAAIGRSRDKDVYICNVLKCRPPNNRDPLPSEVELCEPYLIHQIRLINPKLIVALGRVAGKTLLKVDEPLKAMRSKLHNYHGTPLIVTYHPAALLRNSGFKRPTWEDFQWIQSILEGEK